MQEQQKTFTTQDGTALFYRYRPAADGSSDKAILLFHRGHEHSGRMMFVADELGLDDMAYFAWDARGHGMSPGERGDSPGLGTSVADIQDFVDHIQAAYGIVPQNMVVTVLRMLSRPLVMSQRMLPISNQLLVMQVINRHPQAVAMALAVLLTQPASAVEIQLVQSARLR